MSEAFVLHGDSLVVLKDLPDNSIDSIVTDPPYGLSFMGKKWDYDVPHMDLWREVLRVLKPGGNLLSFGGARTYHRLAVSIEDAGFEIRDQLQWLYGSGFPKSHNLPGGFGTALKPANEPIVLARKPLSEKTVAKNVLRWGTGALNIDASRVGTSDKIASTANQNIRGHLIGSGNNERERDTIYTQSPNGRWPANLILGCDCRVSEDDQFTIHEQGCAVRSLDEQSGHLHPGGQKRARRKCEGVNTTFGSAIESQVSHKDSGGASRFFYVAKASKRERNAGLEGINNHPTVKPIKLMEYLCRLITPPGGTILDPFCGSGSTGVAAKNLGFNFIGIEKELEYVKIAEARINLEVKLNKKTIE